MPKKIVKPIRKEKPRTEEPEDKYDEQMKAVMAAAKRAAVGKVIPVDKDRPRREESSESSSEEELQENEVPFSLEPWEPYFRADGSKPFAMLFLASRGSGKSYLVKSLLRNNLADHFDIAYVITSSPDEAKMYRDVLEGNNIVVEVWSSVPDTLWEDIQKEHLESKAAGKPWRTLVLIDDMAMRTKYDEDIMEMYSQGRHHGTSVMLLLQHSKMCDTIIRTNIDLCFVGPITSPQQRESVIKNILQGYVQGLPSGMKRVEVKAIYDSILDKYTGSEGDFIVVDSRKTQVRGNAGKEKLFYYRAPEGQEEASEEEKESE